MFDTELSYKEATIVQSRWRVALGKASDSSTCALSWKKDARLWNACCIFYRLYRRTHP